ncbi:MAG: helix-turn-helix transcriptional regulator, partial [Pseudomonadota bacterium]|nr:helix-turn-helix transcriptional regulator [Pseudomonadota bacterium]
MPASPTYSFAPFLLNPDERCLSTGGLPLKLGGRAFDTLLTLIERRERTVSKNELLDLVWPGLVVEENNLQVQVVNLRKLLGHHAIATVPGRGYRFTLPVDMEGIAPAPMAAAPGDQGAPGLPLAPQSTAPAIVNLQRESVDLFGRQDDVTAIRSLLRERRVVTITGAGGIGKTRVAEAVATASVGDFADGAWWVELASINDPALVPTAVARALGLSLANIVDTLRSVVSRIGDQSMLIVLDNCEHLLEGVATFVEAVVSASPRLRILVTSQEVLKAAGEAVYRLGTLALPAGTSVEAVVASGSGALLLARIGSASPNFVLNADAAFAAAEICRRLDGIPLAIELAAARVPLMGFEGVRAKLDERFRMLTAGARVVLRRHQTLRAALEWSHGLLSEDERVVFRRLGVFAGGFTLESAQRVAADPELDAWDVLEHLGALVDKSLVLAEGEMLPRYRLLETTRLFALEKLADSNETATATLQHAEAITTLLVAAFDAPAKRWRTTPADWAAGVAELDNTRVALDWAGRQSQDTPLRLELAAASFFAFTSAGLFGEGFGRILAIGSSAHAEVDADVRARFLLAQARIGTQMARTESLDAALQAAALFAALGDDERRYLALACAVAIGARIDKDVDVEALIAQASVLEQPTWPPRLRAWFQWARHRWLLRQGRPDEALAHAWQQVELTHASGAERISVLLRGANVAYCELAMGRADVAEARARVA